MSEDQTTETTETATPIEAGAVEVAQALQARDATVADATIKKVLSVLGQHGLGTERADRPAIMSEGGTVDPSTPPVRAERASIRVSDAIDVRYRTLGWEQGRDVRSPEGDAEIKEFLVALRDRDSYTLQRIQTKARADYGRQLLVGTPDANSGLAGGSGGPLVPLPLSNLLLTILQRTATMRSVSQLFESAATTLRVVLQDGHVTANWTGENAPISTSNATYSDKMLIKKKLTVLTPVSNELLMDSAFNVANLVGQEAGQTMAETEDAALCTSDGTSNQPTEGLDVFAGTLSATHRVAPSGVGTDELDLAFLNNMYWTVHRPYRNSSVWLAPDDVMKLLSQLVDLQGRPILNMMNAPANVVTDRGPAGSVGTIFGRPIVEIPCGAGRLYFGDFRRAYMVLDGSPISAMASEHSQFANDVTEYRFIRRVDGRGGQPGVTNKITFAYSDGITQVS